VRLGAKEVATIKRAIRSYDANATIYLFGSRIDDSKKGGDIDLLVESSCITFKDILKIKTELFLELGDRKIDIVYQKNPFFEQMKKKAIKL